MSTTENDQLTSQIKGLNAQLEAYKQMLNEQLQTSVNLRTNIILYQQAHQEVSLKNTQLQKELDEANKKIEELTPKVEVTE